MVVVIKDDENRSSSFNRYRNGESFSWQSSSTIKINKYRKKVFLPRVGVAQKLEDPSFYINIGAHHNQWCAREKSPEKKQVCRVPVSHINRENHVKRARNIAHRFIYNKKVLICPPNMYNKGCHHHHQTDKRRVHFTQELWVRYFKFHGV